MSHGSSVAVIITPVVHYTATTTTTMPPAVAIGSEISAHCICSPLPRPAVTGHCMHCMCCAVLHKETTPLEGEKT